MSKNTDAAKSNVVQLRPKRSFNLASFPQRIAVDACFISKVKSAKESKPESDAHEAAMVWQECVSRCGIYIPSVALAEFAMANKAFPGDENFRLIAFNSAAVKVIENVVKRNGALNSEKKRIDILIAASVSAHGITDILTYDEKARSIWEAFDLRPRNAASFFSPQLELET